MIRDRIREALAVVAEDCEGKEPAARALLWLYLAYAGIRHVADPFYRSWFAGITLVFHEMGHIVFIPLGLTMRVLGGSLMQLIVPSVAAWYLLVRQRDFFGFTVGVSWLAFSGWDLATYIGDANKEALPLVSMGGTPEHDWSRLLTWWHLLNECEGIASGVRCVAFCLWAFAIGFGGWILVRMKLAPG